MLMMKILMFLGSCGDDFASLRFGDDGEEASLQIPSLPIAATFKSKCMQARRTRIQEVVQIVHLLHLAAVASSYRF